MSTLWTGARQGNATLAAKLAAFDYLDAAPRTLQWPAPSFSHFFFTIGAYLTWTEDFGWAAVGDTSARVKKLDRSSNFEAAFHF